MLLLSLPFGTTVARIGHRASRHNNPRTDFAGSRLFPGESGYSIQRAARWIGPVSELLWQGECRGGRLVCQMASCALGACAVYCLRELARERWEVIFHGFHGGGHCSAQIAVLGHLQQNVIARRLG